MCRLIHEAEGEPTQDADPDAHKVRIPARLAGCGATATAALGSTILFLHNFSSDL
jgi:hypothetical protein